MNISFGYGIDTGLVRKENQDYLLTPPGDRDKILKKGYLFIVADGVGGGKQGDIASELAAKFTFSYYYDYDDFPPGPDLLRSAVQKANREVFTRSGQLGNRGEMTSTITAALILNERLFIAHVGDSRAYLIANKTLRRLTKDHTVVAELGLTEEEAANSPMKNVLSRAVGSGDSIEIDIYEYNLDRNASIIVCSDGLYKDVKETDFIEVVNKYGPQEAVDNFIQMAKNNGGRDNISLFVIKIFKEKRRLHSILSGPLTAPLDYKGIKKIKTFNIEIILIAAVILVVFLVLAIKYRQAEDKVDRQSIIGSLPKDNVQKSDGEPIKPITKSHKVSLAYYDNQFSPNSKLAEHLEKSGFAVDISYGALPGGSARTQNIGPSIFYLGSQEALIGKIAEFFETQKNRVFERKRIDFCIIIGKNIYSIYNKNNKLSEGDNLKPVYGEIINGSGMGGKASEMEAIFNNKKMGPLTINILYIRNEGKKTNRENTVVYISDTVDNEFQNGMKSLFGECCGFWSGDSIQMVIDTGESE